MGTHLIAHQLSHNRPDGHPGARLGWSVPPEVA